MNGQGKVVENAFMLPQLSFVPEAAHQANIPQMNITPIYNAQQSNTNSTRGNNRDRGRARSQIVRQTGENGASDMSIAPLKKTR